ncbi:complex I NDUFA9 subunit family protein [Bradyrhizobium sp. LHD-71]|uniref:complex I NDUFA9 subunit family protein n=1 Tax=Bradyrhizobium sp. LHD-71 TaxID=3072141 RepID=UPI00280C6094|nr:complex I NDUFA9 subunit family protein [Bradyrhizobium sp. LHD-71]MDQ8727966.1 complex I NDUFA9 subunit family protein [Bradyrhizobium sp. LHD-71]
MPLTSPQGDRIIAVFGGTGFLGRRVVRQLRSHEFTVRIVSRHPARGNTSLNDSGSKILAAAADIHDEQSIRVAIGGAYGVVNAVSLYIERGSETFHSVHVDAAARLARLAHETGVQRLVHLSGIGADAASSSSYIRSRGEGERAVRDAFPGATLIRPAVMFGNDDAFLNTILKLLRRLPAYPMFGSGSTRLQPAHVEDVGEAIARAIERDDTRGAVIECGGPRVYSYQELLQTAAQAADLRPRLMPVPFAVWHALARTAEILSNPPLTRNQVELMEIDSVASHDSLGFTELGIWPRSVEQTLEEIA